MKVHHALKNVALIFVAILAFQPAHSSSVQPRVNSEAKEIVCPKSTDDSQKDAEAVADLIAKETTCWGAKNVFEQCAVGNTYSMVSETEPVIEICSKIIAKDKSAHSLYKNAVKQCNREGQSRQAVAIQNQCEREVAQTFGFIVEVVKAHD